MTFSVPILHQSGRGDVKTTLRGPTLNSRRQLNLEKVESIRYFGCWKFVSCVLTCVGDVSNTTLVCQSLRCVV